MASTLGRLDPKTGAYKECRTKTPASGPHGLVADEAGNIWFTANFAGYIGRLDPKTGAIIEYHLPDGVRDPHTPVFDQTGNLWFTVIGADMIGKLVPTTGGIKLVRVPTANALPYGIAVTSEGVPYEFGANKLASIDPKTMQVHEYPDFIMPRLAEPGLLQGWRSLAILEELMGAAEREPSGTTHRDHEG